MLIKKKTLLIENNIFKFISNLRVILNIFWESFNIFDLFQNFVLFYIIFFSPTYIGRLNSNTGFNNTNIIISILFIMNWFNVL